MTVTVPHNKSLVLAPDQAWPLLQETPTRVVLRRRTDPTLPYLCLDDGLTQTGWSPSEGGPSSSPGYPPLEEWTHSADTVPPQLQGRVPLELWRRLVTEAHAFYTNNPVCMTQSEVKWLGLLTCGIGVLLFGGVCWGGRKWVLDSGERELFGGELAVLFRQCGCELKICSTPKVRGQGGVGVAWLLGGAETAIRWLEVEVGGGPQPMLVGASSFVGTVHGGVGPVGVQMVHQPALVTMEESGGAWKGAKG